MVIRFNLVCYVRWLSPNKRDTSTNPTTSSYADGLVQSLPMADRSFNWRLELAVVMHRLDSLPRSVKPRISPLFQQRDSSYQLRDGRLINSAAGSLDEFCIETAMIDTGLSRHRADEGAMLVSQFVLLVMERHRPVLQRPCPPRLTLPRLPRSRYPSGPPRAKGCTLSVRWQPYRTTCAARKA